MFVFWLICSRRGVAAENRYRQRATCRKRLLPLLQCGKAINGFQRMRTAVVGYLVLSKTCGVWHWSLVVEWCREVFPLPKVPFLVSELSSSQLIWPAPFHRQAYDSLVKRHPPDHHSQMAYFLHRINEFGVLTITSINSSHIAVMAGRLKLVSGSNRVPSSLNFPKEGQ